MSNFVITSVTRTVCVACTPLPSAASAMITAVPGATPVTSPVVLLTFAMLSIREDHFTFWLVADFGYTSALSRIVLPFITILLPVMTTSDASADTLTVTVALTPLPSAAVAVIIAFPLSRTLTLQVLSLVFSTFAIFTLLDFHVTA